MRRAYFQWLAQRARALMKGKTLILQVRGDGAAAVCFQWLLFVTLVVVCPAIVVAAPDDREPAKVQDQAQNQFFMNDENFEANVFQPSGNAKQARNSIEAKLRLQIAELNRVCELDEDQIHKLKLAASVDTKRFFDDVDAVRKKYKASKQDQEAWNQIWQEIHPLQMKMSTGLFGDTSFFVKAIRKTLNEKQLTKYDELVTERRRFRYKCSIESVMTTFEDSVPLNHAQRTAMVKLLLDETRPPLLFGQYDQQVVMYQLARIPESKIKTILDERQWALAQNQINQNRGMEQYLMQNGIIEKEDEEVKVLKSRVKRQVLRASTPADAGEPENQGRVTSP